MQNKRINTETSQPKGKFAQLHAAKSKQVKRNRKVSKTLMALCEEDHRAIAQVISAWIGK